MTALELIIGNKKYSSWSMRPWLAMKVKNVEFTETLSQFDIPNNSAHFAEFSPSKKVPVLKHGALTVWDSLAILEYVAELYPDKNWWPADQQKRAHARAVSNEMHSGFPDLRNECPMNMARTPSAIKLTDDARRDIARVETIWRTCLADSGGPFLFGDFTIADAMFAPVVNRFEIYQLATTPAAEQYMQTIQALPAWREWAQAGIDEPWICEHVEI